MPAQGFGQCENCDIHNGDVTLCQSHSTPFGHEQQLCEAELTSHGISIYGSDKMGTDGHENIAMCD